MKILPFINIVPGIALLLFLHNVHIVDSVVARPFPFHASQKDGTSFNIHLKGDRFCNWLEDQNGNVIVKAEEEFYFAREKTSQGKLVPSAYKVGEHDPKDLKLKNPPRPHNIKKQIKGKEVTSGEGRHTPRGQGRRLNDLTTGNLKNLVIPILFSDHQDRDLPTKEDISMLWNALGGHPIHHAATNQSIRDFYLENSYGQLDISSTVIDWVEVSRSESYYAAGQSGGAAQLMELLHEVLEIVDNLVDFSEFDENDDGYIDAIAFVHSGYGAEYGGSDEDGTYYDNRIWSHKWTIFNPSTWEIHPWESNEGVMVGDYHMETILNGVSGSTISTIAVGAHETGHFLGLPDLYDTDGTSSGIDTWGVMANSWGWDYTGNVPPSFSAWSKYVLGWINPSNLTTPGTYELNDIESNDEAFIISLPYADGEFLLIENRQPILSDRQMPDGGLLIWHIDHMVSSENDHEGYYGQAFWPENGYHYMVAVLQADGEFGLEHGYGADAGDMFTGSMDILHNSLDSHPSSLGYQYGVVNPAGFVIQNVSKGEDGVMSFTFASDDSFKINATTFKCNDLLSVEMYDSWGDGWQGTVFQLFEMPSFDAVQEVTLLDGSYDEACLNVEKDTCYYFEAAMVGSWESEVSWSLCDSSGGVDDFLSFCLDVNGTCYEAEACADDVALYMYDAWGDGWNGATFDLYLQDSNTSIQTVTLSTGSEGVTCLLVDDSTCYRFESSLPGSYPSEVYFELCDTVGAFGESLDFCVNANGECYVPDVNCTDDSTEVFLYDSWGDGWTGTTLSLYTEDFEHIQSVTLYDGSYGKDCLDTKSGECYWFAASTISWWESEISFEVCDTVGSVDEHIYFCIDDEGDCSIGEYCSGGTQLMTYDSWGDGWSGTVFTLYALEGNQTTPLQNVTLAEGAEGTQCLDTSEGQCYLFESLNIGSYPSEVSFQFCGGVEGHAMSSFEFCIGANGTCAIKDTECDVVLQMIDLYGDGWDGTTLSLYSTDNATNSLVGEYTLDEGSYGFECLDINKEACYLLNFTDAGSYPSEAVWYMCNTYGQVGDSYAFCLDAIGQCVAELCTSEFQVQMFDSYGDGWNGFEFSLYSADDTSNEEVDTVGLYDGYSGEECLDVKAGSCYLFSVSTVGGWSSEVSWEICGVTGLFDTELSFCVNDDYSCYDVSAEQIDVEVTYWWSSWLSSWWDWSWLTDSGSSWTAISSQSEICNSTMGVIKHDEYGDGWNGGTFELHTFSEESESTVVQIVEMTDGSYGMTCLDIEMGSCYLFAPGERGGWESEISYELCGHSGDSDTAMAFCVDESGTCIMSDDFETETSEEFENLLEDNGTYSGPSLILGITVLVAAMLMP